MFKKLIIIFIFLTILLNAVSCSCDESENGNGLTPPANKAPDFTLTSLQGGNVSLSGLQGKPVILNFWQTNCPYCVAEFLYFEQIYSKYKSQSLEMYAVNILQSASTLNKFLEDNPLTIPILLDSSGNVSADYNVGGIPVTVFIDKNGIIQGKRIGAFTGLDEIEVYLEDILP